MSDKVKRYAPKVFLDNDTTDAIYEVQSEEIDKIDSGIMTVYNNNFISYSDIKGIQNFEKQYEIKSNSNYTLEVRRANLLNKLLFKPPYTRQRFQSILEHIYGTGNYQFEIRPDTFEIVIDIDTIDPYIYLQFNKNVKNILPANMELIYSIQYTYLYLNRYYTYQRFEDDGLTYEELSRYVNASN